MRDSGYAGGNDISCTNGNRSFCVLMQSRYGYLRPYRTCCHHRILGTYHMQVLTVSDRASTGVYEDLSGPAILLFFVDAVESTWRVLVP